MDINAPDPNPFNKEVTCLMANGTGFVGVITGKEVTVGGKVFVELIPEMKKTMIIDIGPKRYAWIQADQIVLIQYDEKEDAGAIELIN